MWRGWPGSRSSLRRSMATCVSTVRLITSSRDKIVGREESPMRLLLLSLTLLLATGDRTSDRDALLAADRALSDKTAARGMVQGFLPSMTEGAASAFAALSVTSGAKNAFLAFATEEAMSFGGGTQMTQGRQAIGAGFDGFPAGAVLEWWPVAAEIAPSGDLGCTVGEATIASLNHYSKYLTIWRRQPDGTWKFVADGGNLRPAP